MDSDNRKTKAQLINELDAARRRLSELEKYSIIEKSIDGIAVLQDGLVKFANKKASEIFGFTKEDTLTRPFIEFVAPRHREMVAEIYRKRLLGLVTPSAYETVLLDNKEAEIPVEINASLIEFEGRPATLAIIRDISERKKYSESLKASEEKFKTLAEKSPNMVFINKAGKIVYANQQCEKTMGYSIEELYGPNFNFMALVAPHSIESVQNSLKQHTAGKDIAPVEYTFVTKNGQPIECILSTKIIDFDGSKAILGVVTDITAQKQTEKALSLQAGMLDAVSDAIFVHDSDGNLTYVNTAACKMCGCNKVKLLKMNIGQLADPETARFIAPAIQKVLNNGEAIFELTSIAESGSKVPVEIHASLMPLGRKKMIISIARDITERKRTQEVLAFQANLLDASKDTIIVHDLDGNIAYANNAACDTFGYSREELLKMNLRQIADPETSRMIRPNLNYTVEKGQATFEVTNRCKDGSEISREIHDSLLRIGGRDMIVGIGHDITERKRLQSQMIMQDRLASIGQFVSGIAHELNNPLTSVIGFSELLLEKELPDDVRGDLKIISDEARRTTTIVKNLLTFARQRPQEKQPVLINEPIQAVLQLRSHEHGLNNVKVNTHFAHDPPLIRGNISQLQQVFFNLVANAEFALLDAHHEGTVTITTELVKDFIRVSVADDGPGISPENMKRLFNPFFTTKPPGKGTGLGLSICQGIISEHGGRIWAESEPGKGATFFIELPVCK